MKIAVHDASGIRIGACLDRPRKDARFCNRLFYNRLLRISCVVSGCFVSGYRFSDSAIFRNQTPLLGAGFRRTPLRAASHFESHEHPNMVTANQERFFFEHYGLTNHDLEIYLTAALSAGGDYADLYFEYLTSTSLMVDESLVKSASQGISAGCGVRVVSGERTGYAYTDDLSPQRILHAARTAALIASGPAKTP